MDPTPHDDPAAVLGAHGSVLPPESSEPREVAEAFQAETRAVSDEPMPAAEAGRAEDAAPDAAVAIERLPDEAVAADAGEAERSPGTSAAHSDSAPAAAPARSLAAWASALAVCRLRFVDGLSAAKVQKRLGVDRAYYERCTRWMLDVASATLTTAPCGDCDYRALADAAIGVAPLAVTAAVNEHAKSCSACAAYTQDFCAEAVRIITAEQQAPVGSGAPSFRYQMEAEQARGLIRKPGAARNSGASPRRTPATASPAGERPSPSASPPAPAPAQSGRRRKPSGKKLIAGALLAATGGAGVAGAAGVQTPLSHPATPFAQPDGPQGPLAVELGPQPEGPPPLDRPTVNEGRDAPPVASVSPGVPSPHVAHAPSTAISAPAPATPDIAMQPVAGDGQAVDASAHEASIAAAKAYAVARQRVTPSVDESTQELGSAAASVDSPRSDKRPAAPSAPKSDERPAAASAPKSDERPAAASAPSRQRPAAPSAPKSDERPAAASAPSDPIAPAPTAQARPRAVAVNPTAPEPPVEIAAGIDNAATAVPAPDVNAAAATNANDAIAGAADARAEVHDAMAAATQSAVLAARQQIASAFEDAGVSPSVADQSQVADGVPAAPDDAAAAAPESIDASGLASMISDSVQTPLSV